MISGVIGEIYAAYGLLLVTAIVIGFLCFRYYLLNRDRIGNSQWIIWLLNGGIFLMLGVPMAAHLFVSGGWMMYVNSTSRFVANVLPAAPFVICAYAALGAGIYFIARRRWSHLQYLCFLFLPAFLATRILCLILVDPQPYSDFATMWDLIEKVARNHTLILPGDYKNPTVNDLIFLRRILPIWSPLALVFGSSHLVYKISNVLFSLASSLASYYLANKYFGKRAAQLGIWLIVFVPELILTVGHPTHDLLGTFCLMAFLLLFDRTYVFQRLKRPVICAFLGVMSGLAWLILDIQRDLGVFVIAGLFIWISITITRNFFLEMGSGRSGRWRRALTTLLFLFLIPLGVYKGVGAVASHAGLYTPFDQSPFWKYLFTSLDCTTGKPDSGIAIWKDTAVASSFLETQPSKEIWDQYYGNAIPSEYLYNQLRYIPQLVNRMGELLELGGTISFYLARMTKSSIVQPDSPLSGAFRIYDLIYMVAFLFTGAAALFRILSNGRMNPRKYPPLVVLSAMIFIILIVAQVQSRYSYPIWLILPIYIGAAMDGWLSSSPYSEFYPARLFWGFGLAICIGLFCLLAVMGLYSFSPNKVLFQGSWHVDSSVADAFQRQNSGYIPALNMIRMSTCLCRQPQPGDWTRATAIVREADRSASYTVIGMIQAPHYIVKKGEPESLELSISINGELAKQFPCSKVTVNRFVAIPGVRPDAQGNIVLAMETKALLPIPDKDWQDISSLLFHRFCVLKESAGNQ